MGRIRNRGSGERTRCQYELACAQVDFRNSSEIKATSLSRSLFATQVSAGSRSHCGAKHLRRVRAGRFRTPRARVLADLPVLQDLRQTCSDWRMESCADDLIRILKNRDGTGDEPEQSMFNPKNAAYILKRGCAGR